MLISTINTHIFSENTTTVLFISCYLTIFLLNKYFVIVKIIRKDFMRQKCSYIFQTTNLTVLGYSTKQR